MRTQRIHRNDEQQRVNPRLFVVYAVIGLAMLTLVTGLGWKQVILKASYDAVEQRQNYRRILMPGPRGDILDRNSELLVGNRPMFSAVVYLNDLRREFRDEYIQLVRREREIGVTSDRFALNTRARLRVVQRHLTELNAILGSDFEVSSRDVERHFSQALLLPFPLARDLTGEQYARLIEQVPLDSPVQVRSGTARFYPFADAAAHLLGFVSESTEFADSSLPGDQLLTFRNEGQIGRSGLELAFNEALQGRTGGEIWTVDPSGFTHERVVHEQPQKGSDLRTSLDIHLQLVAEAALGEQTGAVVAIDIRTGEVLAMVSKPAYDLNDLSPFLSFVVDAQIREQGAWINRAIQGLYPPGSTFKLVTALAALRSGVVDEATVIHCSGSHMVGRRLFHCHRRSGHGDEDLVGAIRDSCNVYFYDRALEMGVWPLAQEAQRFRLDQPTGIELPAETGRMLIPDPEWKAGRFYGEGWFGGDTANMSIGQGFVLVTPLQMAVFTASLASGTTFVQPTLLHVPQGSVAQRGQPIGLSAEQLQLIHDGMVAAGERGTARLASSARLPVAGKTGTAQVRKDGRPSTLAWFVGYAPLDHPQLAVAVMVEGVPESEISVAGGATAAPIARAVFEHHLLPPAVSSIHANPSTGLQTAEPGY